MANSSIAGAGVTAAMLVGACGGDAPTETEPDPLRLDVTAVAGGLAEPVHLTSPPGDGRLFVTERHGTVRIIEDGTVRSDPFLDIRDRVGADGSEQGLLSLAFDPAFEANGRFYVYFTDRAGDGQVVRYAVDPGAPSRADPATAHTILSVEQPFANHNGGLLEFGPAGMLWVGLGDGGSGGDPAGNGQDSTTLLGSLLRLDVHGGDPYAIPADNPFAGSAGGRGEIWAYGLRNPWRYDLDPVEGRLYIADVGQSDREEVNARPLGEAGLNYGWKVMEGRRCFRSEDCDREGLVLPVLDYGHSEGCSVTGGHVYRGEAIPRLRGHYFYADFCAGWIRSFRLQGDGVTERTEWDLPDLGRIPSFGTDSDGELYVLSSGGTVYRVVPE